MKNLVRVATGLALAISLVVGMAFQPANAAPVPEKQAVHTSTTTTTTAHERVSGGCSAGACTMYLNQSETVALSRGRVPAPPAVVSGVLRVAYYALALGHILIAKGYVARRVCVGFTLNIRPWATQGMFGYRCTWR